MSDQKYYRRVTVSQFEDQGPIEKEVLLIVEEPLEVRVNGIAYAVLMRTPGNEIELAAGFCLTEGIVDSFEEIDAIGFCPDAGEDEENVVTVTTNAFAAERIVSTAGLSRNRVSRTGCGICGVQTIEDLTLRLSCLPGGYTVPAERIIELQYVMSDHQALSRLTRSAHAVALSDNRRLHVVREDVGRHNALDKAIGYAMLNGVDLRSSVVLLSSRISFEMVQKAVRAGIPVVAAISAATSLAVDLALRFDCTLAGLLRDRSMVVYTGAEKNSAPGGIKTKRYETLSTTRVDLVVAKGSEETFDPEFYALCGGLWIEEQDCRVLVKCYPPDVPPFLAYLDRSGWLSDNISVIEEEEKDYVALVRQHFTPIRVGDVLILPPWRRTKRKGHTIVIEPGMAFGTGRHESTRLMIRMMGRAGIKGKKVLDIGSGSGILAIYAWLLGAASVVAADHDPLATEAVQKGCALNHARRIRVVCSGVEGIKGKFQVVLANLDFNTFKAHAGDVTRLVEDGGWLIVSGIERQYAGDTPALFEPAILVKKTRMKDWHGFVFRVGRA